MKGLSVISASRIIEDRNALVRLHDVNQPSTSRSADLLRELERLRLIGARRHDCLIAERLEVHLVYRTPAARAERTPK